MQDSKAICDICATQYPGLSSISVSYQVKNECVPNLFKKKKISKTVLSGFLEVGWGNRPSHGISPSPPPPPHTHLQFKEEVGFGGRGASCPGHGILFPIPSNLEKKQLMINIVNIQMMTGQ